MESAPYPSFATDLVLQITHCPLMTSDSPSSSSKGKFSDIIDRTKYRLSRLQGDGSSNTGSAGSASSAGKSPAQSAHMTSPLQKPYITRKLPQSKLNELMRPVKVPPGLSTERREEVGTLQLAAFSGSEVVAASARARMWRDEYENGKITLDEFERRTAQTERIHSNWAQSQEQKSGTTSSKSNGKADTVTTAAYPSKSGGEES